jgi:hypothetical protein
MNTVTKEEFELYYAITNPNRDNFTSKLIFLILKADIVNEMKLATIYPKLTKVVNKYQNEKGYWEKLCEKIENRK